jgi:hypothetical protein
LLSGAGRPLGEPRSKFLKKFRAGDANYFELILLNYLSHFTKLMEAYHQAQEEKI